MLVGLDVALACAGVATIVYFTILTGVALFEPA